MLIQGDQDENSGGCYLRTVMLIVKEVMGKCHFIRILWLVRFDILHCVCTCN